jgi:hypothetical protein
VIEYEIPTTGLARDVMKRHHFAKEWIKNNSTSCETTHTLFEIDDFGYRSTIIKSSTLLPIDERLINYDEGHYFYELKIVGDNITYIKTIEHIKEKKNASITSTTHIAHGAKMVFNDDAEAVLFRLNMP